MINDDLRVISYWKRPFLYLSGTDIKTISQCAPDLATRYSILGGLLCIPALVAFFSSSYAVSFLFPETSYKYYAGVIWALIILTIDRSIVAQNPEIAEDPVMLQSANLSKGAKFRSRSIIVGRIFISIILGFVIAEPLCIKIFDDEIQEQIHNSKENEFSTKRKSLDSVLVSMENEIKAKEQDWLNAQKVATDESDGTTGPRGTGDVFRHKQGVADILKKKYETVEREQRVNQDSIRREIDSLKKGINTNKATNLTGRMHALNQVASNNQDLLISIWLLRLLFVCIELIPLILKTSLKRKSDSYVVLCHQNNKKTIALNTDNEHNLAVKQMLRDRFKDDLKTNKMLKSRKMENIAKDLNFYLKINQNAADTFERECGIVEKTITDQEIRKATIAKMAESYLKFTTKLTEVYNTENGINDKQS